MSALTQILASTPQVNLADRRPEALQYLGASFGVTAPLLGFWQRAGYLPVYLRQTPSDVSTATQIVWEVRPRVHPHWKAQSPSDIGFLAGIGASCTLQLLGRQTPFDQNL